MEKVRFGIIGTGGMGQGHLQMQASIEEAQLTAICDIDAELRERLAAQYEVPAFATHTELLESGLVDAVIIATPHYFHPPIAIEAMRKGIHVLSEKPIAVTVKAADAMIATARETGVQFGVMFQMRSQKEYRLARKAIDEGIIGEIYRTSLTMGWYRSQAYYDSATWRATWAGEGGGVLLNQAPHNLDLFTWLAGMPAKVTAQVRTRLHDIEVEDEAFALLEYPNGAHGYLYCSVNEAPGVSRMEICGDRGKIVVDEHGLRISRCVPPVRVFTVNSTEMWKAPASEPVELEVPEMPASHATITRAFARAILYGEPLLAPGEEGIRELELSNAIILSGKRGKTVELPLDRDEYEELLAELVATSRAKERVVAQRVTDPNVK
ncbi:MAG: Gfo/Idh/MocA family oxidoreductase [Armatimonadetes bacterium]|nr:Gfo/Idh/MocA family oxidoreductase [Armatimonadota bacterium]